MPEYPQRDIEAQGEHYLRHVNAMTEEGLTEKSDIAAELAARDIAIDKLRAAILDLNHEYKQEVETLRTAGATAIEHAAELASQCSYFDRNPGRCTASLWVNRIGRVVFGHGPTAWAAVQDAHAKKKEEDDKPY